MKIIIPRAEQNNKISVSDETMGRARKGKQSLPFFLLPSHRPPRSPLFHSLQSLVCLCSSPALLIISLSPVPCLSLLVPRAPLYFTLSSPLFVSARPPRSSLFHSLQSLVCLCSTPALLFISLSPVPCLSLLDPRAPLYFTLSSPLFVSARARKKPLRRREGSLRNVSSPTSQKSVCERGHFHHS